MKQIAAFLLLLLTGLGLQAGVPQGLNYQAVARDANGLVLPNKPVNVRFTVHDSVLNGAVVYQETDTATTNAFGLFTTVIGHGVPVSGYFDSINWGVNAKFLQVELDPTGGSTFTDMGTAQMQSVPYAMYAGNVPHVGFRVTAAPQVAITNTADYPRIYKTIDFNDGGGTYDTATGYYTVGSPGLYHFAANEDIHFPAGTFTGYLTIAIMVNNAFASETDFLPGNNQYLSLSTWTDVQVKAGDLISVQILTAVNANIDEYISDSYTNFTGYKIY
jgi:C1q domain